MGELDRLKQTKEYIDKLANGVNPVTDETVPEDSIINQVQLVRCFFYLSDVLRRVIENDEAAEQKKKPVKQKLVLSEEFKQRFNFPNKPVTISEFVRAVNGSIDLERMRKLPYRAITGWLKEKGFLIEFVDSLGKTRKMPSEQGALIGISLEKRFGMYGEYTVVLYNDQAQRFILDNIDEILESYGSK